MHGTTIKKIVELFLTECNVRYELKAFGFEFVFTHILWRKISV